MENLLKKEAIVPFLIPSSETFKKLLDICINSKIADLVIQEGKGISIITATKETKSLKNINDKISSKAEFIESCITDIIKDSEKRNNFLQNEDISEVSVGINYTYYKNSEQEGEGLGETLIASSEGKNTGKIVRLRCTCIKELRGFQINIRIGNISVPDYNEIGISEDFRQLFQYKEGLILVAGPTGSGKTTTINSLLKDILLKEHKHLLTLEDPVEYVYVDSEIAGLVTYREQGNNFKNYPEGIKNALRLSPNIIMIGEIRDADTANAVIEAVLGGHLVISTLHTSSVIGTVQKFVKWAQSSGNEENISVFGDFLRGIMIQKLIKVPGVNGKSVTIPVREMLYGEKKIASAIKGENGKPEYKTLEVKMNEVGSKSISMNKYLIDLYVKGLITSPKIIFDNSNNIEGLLDMIKEDKLKYELIFKNNIEEYNEQLAKYRDK